ncbi:MFS transporter [Kaistia nematophila]|uniref:MFS transporter n=1 Tax=Kaistia nematophila TaxID=2994654 RepID=A0A9X3IKU3_9HYPH|nr:MFS transporter [Kaistia nematophila]MCX5568175.1 MFS transporter [Kaistia nematophila]
MDFPATSGTGTRAPTGSSWSTVFCLSLLCFALVASEFMPVSLLTPIANDLAITEGQAGQAIAISGIFAVVASLFGNSLLSSLDRRSAVLLYTGLTIVSGLVVTFAPNYAVFMIGRALIGVAIGGFWSLSTAILARIVPTRDLAKAIAMLQGGTAFATVIAPPMGSFLGGLIGWRGAFFTVVPVGLIGLIWQLAVIPKLPAERSVSVGYMFGLMRNHTFAIGIVATTLAFMGQFALSTYLRPFLEVVTGFDVNALSLTLLGLGLAGLLGTAVIGFVLRSHLAIAVIGLPTGLAVLSLLLITFGHVPFATVVMLILWGLFANPIPVAWNTWMARVIPDDLEAGGGLQVALIQFAITTGAFGGGLLFDAVGWWAPFALATLLLTASAGTAAFATPAKANHV